MKTRDGGPAFPAVSKGEMGVGGGDGMTLRDYFAGQALTGMLADRLHGKPQEWARVAYAMADALLAEREKSYE